MINAVSIENDDVKSDLASQEQSQSMKERGGHHELGLHVGIVTTRLIIVTNPCISISQFEATQ